MSITVKKLALSEHHEAREAHPVATEHHLNFIGNVEVQCLVRLGTLTMTINELRQLKTGQILELEQKTQEPVDIVLNNQVIARGELMSCEEHFAIKIIEVCC